MEEKRSEGQEVEEQQRRPKGLHFGTGLEACCYYFQNN